MKRMVVDNKVCTSCSYCEVVCSMVHSEGLVNRLQSRVKVRADNLDGTAVISICRQCKSPQCVQACPHFAISQDASLGTPVIDTGRCQGVSCLACLQACPYGALYFGTDAGIPVTCDLCGGDPMCIKFCRTYPHIGHAALSYVDAKKRGTY
jgi:anaerobic carbon-monoxide dehydrogenase iron sulfur subunit